MSIFKTFWLLWVASKGARGAWVQVVGEFGSSSITSCRERAARPWGVCVMDGGQLCPVQMWQC